MMEVENFSIRHRFPIPWDTRAELNHLCDQFKCPINLLIESFIARDSYPEEAFPYYRAESFLDNVGQAIRHAPRFTITSCSVCKDELIVITLVSRKLLMEWVQ